MPGSLTGALLKKSWGVHTFFFVTISFFFLVIPVFSAFVLAEWIVFGGGQ